MDTRLIPNEPETRAESPDTGETGRERVPRRRKTPETKYSERGPVNRLLGTALLLAAVGLLTMGVICAANLNNSKKTYSTLWGNHGTSINFYYAGYKDSFLYELAEPLDKLYIYLTVMDESVDLSPGSRYWGDLQKLYDDNGMYNIDPNILSEQISSAYSGASSYDSSYTVPPISEVTVTEDASSTTYSTSEAAISDIASVYVTEPGITWSIEMDEVSDLYNQNIRLQIKEAAAESLAAEQIVLFYVNLPDGGVFTNISGGRDNVTAYREASLLTFSLTEPPGELYSYLGDYDAYSVVQACRAMGISGEIFIPSGAWEMQTQFAYILHENNIAGEQLHSMNILIKICFAGLAVVLAAALFSFRKSFMWAFGKVYGLYSKQPFLLKLALTLASIALTIQFIQSMGAYYSYRIYFGDMGFIAAFMICCLVALYLVLSAVHLAVLLPGGRRALRSEPDIRGLMAYLDNMRYTFKTRHKPLIICAVLVNLSILAMILLLIVALSEGADAEVFMPLLLLAGLWLLLSGLFLSLIFSYAKISARTEDITRGVFHEYGEVKGYFRQSLNNLARINDGMRRAITEAVRSERLKSELITNVSHDLKTPLTSIINYVALLKETSVAQTPAAAEYLDVIDKKTQRLQVLIDDLFEAAKLNSGSAVLHPEEVNAVDLLKQALGELSEKIDTSGVNFICHYETERVMLWLDGKKIWRVFENLIGNILKYAPAGSRAYISAEELGSSAVFTFKNVSNYALDFEPEELFERFKRGDTSRSTEGSGLGLSIARGIVEQSGGYMRITTDGDLFKVVVEFPLS